MDHLINLHCRTKLSFKTRMHSSRMRTVSCGGLLKRGWWCLPGGSVCLGGRGGFSLGECLPGGGGGVCLGVYPACNEADTPLGTEFLTHACGKITFPQLLLRTVIRPFLGTFLLHFYSTAVSHNSCAKGKCM